MRAPAQTAAGLSAAEKRALLARKLGVEDAAAIFPLSFSQQRFWLLEQLYPGLPVYNVPVALRLQGPLSLAALEHGLNAIVRRHQTLRTTLRQVKGRPVQVVATATPLALALVDIAAIARQRRHDELLRVATAEARRRFDLQRGPLLRVRLVRLTAEDHVLVLVMHHAVVDIWSMDILLRELSQSYIAGVVGRAARLPELRVQYTDFAVWQRRWLRDEKLAEQLAYWRDQFRSEPPVVALPTDRPRPAAQSFRGAVARRRLPAAVATASRALSGATGATLFTTFLALFQVLLYRYTGKADVVVGTPVVNRGRRETEALIGVFTNTLALRTRLMAGRGFRHHLQRVQQQLLDALAYQDLPFERLVEELQPERDLGQMPLFQQMFIFQQSPAEKLDLPGVRSRMLPLHTATAKFDLTLTVEENEESFEIQAEYSTDLFQRTTIERLMRHYECLLAAATVNDEPLASLALVAAGERQQLLVEWNDTAGAAPAASGMHQPFESQARRTPRATALMAGPRRLSYAELDRRAERLAAVLRQRGVGPEVAVGIFLERSERLVVAVLAVLKAGGAYVPLDPAYPQERIAYILDTLAAPLVLSERALGERLPSTDAAVLELDGELHAGAEAAPARPQGSPRQLAYVIFTSGSTGRPKGVAIEHRSALQLLAWARRTFAPQDLSGVLAATSICFDLSVFELFVPLSWGGTVVLTDNALELPAAAAATRLVNTVPSAMAEVLRLGPLPAALRTVNLAGEVLTRSLVDRIYAGGQVARVWNLYGPSEDTTYSTGVVVPPAVAAEPTIGRPITATRAYELDRRLRPLPVGVPGELYLAGAGLARGYFANPQQTAANFVPDANRGPAGGRLYRTGDLARYRTDGELEFLGRIDQQVKLRGFRIELGEIESVLQAHPGISEVAVVARDYGAGDQRLVAYLVAAAGRPSTAVPAADRLRAFLRQRLPEYMVPAAFVPLDSLPRTPSGKTDRRALPQPEKRSADAAASYVAPRNQREEAVAAIFSRVLQREPIGIHDNFFDLGGHSLLGTRVMSAIEQEFHLELPLATLLERPTVATLTTAIEEALLASIDQQEMAQLIAELED